MKKDNCTYVPKISVITICYNAVESIEKTILSVLNQTYNNIEFIVVDGASTDGTIEIVNKYKEKISHFISEPDKGIYDAMNKGIKAANGEWINFMNAGDTFYSKNSVSLMINKFLRDGNIDVYYGYQVHSFEYGKYIRKRLPLEYFSRCMPIGHASTFVRSALLKESGFDCRFKVAADYNFFYNLYMSGGLFHFIDVIVADFEATEGVSSNDKNALLTFYETSVINKSFASPSFHFSKLLLKVRLFAKRLFCCFPSRFLTIIQKIKREHNQEYININNFKKTIPHENFSDYSCL